MATTSKTGTKCEPLTISEKVSIINEVHGLIKVHHTKTVEQLRALTY
jgi:hypothetical protein